MTLAELEELERMVNEEGYEPQGLKYGLDLELDLHQSKYPHYDVGGCACPGHCNVCRNTWAQGIVMSEIKI